MGKSTTWFRKRVSAIRQLIKWELTPLRIIVLYVVVGGLWMLFSDELLILIIDDPITRAHLEILTDWLYIVATAWMLYVLITHNIAATQKATEALRQSEEQFRQLAEHIQEAFWIYTPTEGRFIYVSPAYEKIWGRAPESLYQHRESWLDAIHPADLGRITAALDKRGRGEYDEVYRIVNPDGAIRWVRDRSFPIMDDAGQTYRVCGVTQDITEQVLAQEKLEERVEERTREIERQRDVAEGLRDILSELNTNHPLDNILHFIASRSGQLLGANGVAICRLQDEGKTSQIQAACGTLKSCAGYTELPLGHQFLRRAVAGCRPVFVSDVRTALASGGSLATDNGPVTLDVEPPVQAQWTDCCGAMLAAPLVVKDEIYGGLILYYPTPRQFSEEETELIVTLADHAALAIENARLRAQMKQTAVAAERSRLARDLHDSVAQALYSMTLYAEATKIAMAAGKQDIVAKNLEELHGMAREAMLDMRMLIFELHPSILKDEGLVAALRARLAAVESRAELHVEIRAQGEKSLPLAIEEELYWIAQEALSNAVKHAKAQRVTVSLQFGDEKVCLEVNDDGLGFDAAEVKRGGGMGMRGIEERVQRIGGKLEVRSVSKEGTTVRVEVRTI